MVAGVELTYNRGASALNMANTIFGDGVTVTGANYIGDSDSSAIFSNGDAISPGVVPGDSGVILSTGDVRAFTSEGSQSNVRSNMTTPSSGPNNHPLFEDVATGNTFDGSILEVDFIPDPDINFITMEFVFSSDEYPEYVGSIYNDLFGVWIDGEYVPLAAGNGEISISNLNESGGPNLFRLNTQDQYNTEMDGFTISLSVVIPVTPGEVNNLQIGIADAGDSAYDSNVLIAADSVQGAIVAVDDRVLLRPGDAKTVDVVANDLNLTGGSVVITHINDVPVLPGDSVTLTTGQTITLNADGTLDMIGNSVSTDVVFTYEIASTTGDTAVGIVTIDTVPCFTTGTMIRTDRGERPVETLTIGQNVLTRDHGPQPIRWIGRRRMAAEGPMAPVRIAAGTFGDHDALTVSPLHRVLIQNAQADILFGSPEVLIAARDLVDGKRITTLEGGQVEYVHLLFDQHQVIWSDGLPSESFLPGPQTTHCFDAERIAEICTHLPRVGSQNRPRLRPRRTPDAETLRSQASGGLGLQQIGNRRRKL